jgi:hypothetical protein
MTPARVSPSIRRSCFVRRSLRWAFLNRRTGHITLVQWPNIALCVWVVLSIVLHAFRPMGAIEILIRVVADLAILVWALDELARGVNPFRRVLGLVVIIATLVALSLQVH